MRERDPVDRMLGESLADDAAAGRRREHWLRTVAAEEATLGGVLVDHGESGRHVVMITGAGREVAGTVVVVGADVVAVRVRHGAVVLVALDALAAVRSAPGSPVADGGRRVQGGVTLAGLLADAAAERPEARLVLRCGAVLVGQLRSVGLEVVALRPEGGGVAHARLGSLSEVSLESG